MNESTATVYQRARRRAEARAVAAAAAVLAVLAATNAGAALAGWCASIGAAAPPGLQTLTSVTLFAAVVTGVCALAGMAARGDSFHDKGAAEASAISSRAAARVAGVFVAVATFGSLIVIVAVRWLGAWWWIGASAAIGAALVGAARAVPVVMAWLDRPQPLNRPGLVGRLRDMARQAHVDVTAVETIAGGDRVGATALVTGFGQSRRIYLSAALVDRWSDDEIAVVVAHELAHHAHHDLWRSLGLDVAVLTAGAAVAQIVVAATARQAGGTAADLALLPLIAGVMGLVWLAATPLRHAESRRQERLADAAALVMTGHADAFGSALRRLSAERLAEERPTQLTQWLFHRHPPVAERLAMAEAYKSGFRVQRSASETER